MRICSFTAIGTTRAIEAARIFRASQADPIASARRLQNFGTKIPSRSGQSRSRPTKSA